MSIDTWVNGQWTMTMQILKVKISEWRPKPMDVYEYFIWDPYIMSLEGIPEDFSDFFQLSSDEKLFRKAAKQLFRSRRIAYYKPKFKKRHLKREPLILREAIKELFRSARIVDYCPFLRTRTPLTNVCSIPATRRLLNLLSVWYGFDIKKAGPPMVTWKERQQYLREQKRLAEAKIKFIDNSFRAFRRMMEKIDWLERKKEESRLYIKVCPQRIKRETSLIAETQWKIYKQERRRITDQIARLDNMRCQNYRQIVKLHKQIEKLKDQDAMLTASMHQLEVKRKTLDFTPKISN